MISVETNQVITFYGYMAEYVLHLRKTAGQFTVISSHRLTKSTWRILMFFLSVSYVTFSAHISVLVYPLYVKIGMYYRICVLIVLALYSHTEYNVNILTL